MGDAMRPFPTHKKRPTIDDARQAFEDGITGGWKPADVPTGAQCASMAKSLAKNLSETMDRNFPDTDNVEYAILKCHLLVEHVLERYIECMSQHASPNTRRFTFSHKLDIAAMLGFGANCKLTIPSVEMLNRIRNQVAHHFEIDIAILDELHQWWAEDPDEICNSTDIDRIQFLNWFCGFLAGSVAGEIEASVVMLHEEEFRSANTVTEGDDKANNGESDSA